MCRWFLLPIVITSVLANAQEARPVNLFSKAKETALGASLAAGVRNSVTVVASPAVSQYVERVGHRVAAALPDQGIPYTFTIVQNDLGGSTNEPLALPGGAIFIPAHLLLAARSEAEFAGMLSHAIAHVAARHGTRLASRAQLEGRTFVPVMYSNLGRPEAGDESLRDLQRSFEMEADALTVGMMTRAEYQPEAFAAYLAREQKDTEGTWSPLLPREERVARIRDSIVQLPQNEHLQMQDELRRLLPVAKVP